jgi:LysM repeat protein
MTKKVFLCRILYCLIIGILLGDLFMSQMVTRPRKQRIKDRRTHTFKRRLIAATFATFFTIVLITVVYWGGDKIKALAFAENYTVQQDDTLYGLSKKFDSSVGEIKAINSLKEDTILTGQKLIIPNPTTPTEHIVKKGETVYSISKQYQINIVDLVKENKLKNNHIYIGQKLKISFSENGTYEVTKNDTLHSIAKRHRIGIEDLTRLNELKSNTIKIGQTLIVPNDAHHPNNNQQAEMGISEFYTVAKGDTLWSISKRFDVPFSTLKAVNQLVVEQVVVGQKLFIPGQKRFEATVVVGAADSQTVEFTVQNHPVPLKVAKGTATTFQNLIGQEGFIAYKNGALISFY